MQEQSTTAIETISVQEAAQRMGVSSRTIQYWLQSGKLPKYQICGRTRINPQDLLPKFVTPPPPAAEPAQPEPDAPAPRQTRKASTSRKARKQAQDFSAIRERLGVKA